MVRLEQLLAVLPGVGDDIGKRFEASLARVIAGKYRRDAGMRQCLGCIEPDDLGMSTVGAQEYRVQLTRETPIRRVAALAGNKA